MKTLSLLFTCQVFLAATPCVFAAQTGERLRESEAKQEQIQSDAKALVSALDEMAAEYERNNLGGEEVATVKRLRGSLDKLSVAEMKQVVDLLQQARAVKDPGAAAKTVADAFSAQKQIVVSIKRILSDHAREQQAQEIARTLNDLGDRQSRNLQNGIELGRMAGATKPENFEAMMQAQLEAQRGEQTAIADEVKMARARIEKFAADPENAGVAEKFKAGAQQLQRVEPVASSATDALKAGQVFKAVTDEKTSRDELRNVARQIAPRERGVEALRKAEREVAQMIRDQDLLVANTAKQKATQDFDKWLAEKIAEKDPNKTLEGKFRKLTPEQMRASKPLREKFENENREKGAQLAKLEDQQGELAVKTNALGQDLADTKLASDALRDANAKMQEARSAMQDANASQAQTQQLAAAEKLRAVHAELHKRADEAEVLAGNSGDKIKDLDRLQQVAKEMAKQENEIARAAAPDKAMQADISKRAAQMAERAAQLAPKAEKSMQAAAADAKQGDQALQANNAQQGKQEAAEAAKNFEEAVKQIGEELAQAQAAQQQIQQAEKSLADLAKIIASEQAIGLATIKATATKKPDDLRALSPQQAQTQQQTEALKQSLAADLAIAAQPLTDAATEMGAARTHLEAKAGPQARAAEERALKELFNAQRALTAKLADAQQQLGKEVSAVDAAEAAADLAEAQAQLQQAQANLEKAAQQMGQQAAQNAAQAAQQAAAAAQQAAQAAQNAQQQAQQANNPQAAQQAGQAAQQAAQAAQAAQQAAQAAQQMAQGEQPAQAGQQAAQQAGQAAQAAQQAAQAAQAAQQAAEQGAQQAAQAGQPAEQAANQQAAQQAGEAAQAAQQAAQQAQQAQQMANAAAQAAQQNAAQAAQEMQQAAQQLAQAAQQAAEAAAEQGAASPAAQEAAQQAAQQLSDAAAQAQSGQTAAAQQSAQQAAQSLAQAAGMAAAQQAGISQQPGQGQGQGQGQGEGQGEGQGQGEGKGKGQGKGQGKGSGPNSKSGNGPSEGADSYKPGDPEAVQREARQAAIKKAGFLGLPPREREAIQQSLGEKYPQEYGAMVEQYLLNLANESAKK